MSRLLKVLKDIKINAEQTALPGFNNIAIIRLTFPRRRLHIDVTRNIQNLGNEGYTASSGTSG